jgi:hypothetical protein
MNKIKKAVRKPRFLNNSPLKIVFLALCFLFSRAERGAGLELDFSWSLGEAEVYYGSSANSIDGRLSLGRFNLLANGKFSLEVQLVNMGNIAGETISYSFLPLKAEYRLISLWDVFYVGLYGKAAWQFTQNQDGFNLFTRAGSRGFYGGAGLEFLLPIPMSLRYKANIALFTEYGFPEGFKAGVTVDLLSLFALF